MSEVTILSETAYIDTTAPPDQQKKVIITFLTPTNQIGHVTLLTKEYSKDKRDYAIREYVKKIVVKPMEKVKL